MGINFSTGTQSYPGNIVLHSEVALNGNSQANWTSIPQGVKSIVVSFSNISHNGNGNTLLIQIGDNVSGVLTSGYTGTWMHENLAGGAGGRTNRNGFEFYQQGTAYYGSGIAHLQLHDDGNTHYWVCTMVIGQQSSEHVVHGGGFRSLSGSSRYLDRVRFSTSTGNFDSGLATLSYSW